jgi:phosphate/sulfate permease
VSVPERADLATNANAAQKRGKNPLFVGNVVIAPVSAFLALVAWLLLEWYLTWDAVSSAPILGGMVVAGISTGLVARGRGRRTVVIASVAAAAMAFLYFWIELFAAFLTYLAAGGQVG